MSVYIYIYITSSKGIVKVLPVKERSGFFLAFNELYPQYEHYFVDVVICNSALVSSHSMSFFVMWLHDKRT